MLLHFLEFNNFMMFHGKHRMEFLTEKRADKPFTVILAPTNSGKTTTIRALRYLLYGTLDGKPLGRPDKLISHREKLRCAQGAQVESWVQAKIKFGEKEDQTITFRRRIVSTRIGTGIDGFEPGTEHLEELQLQKGGAGNVWRANARMIESLIHTHAPSLLFNLFVFAGEPGEGRIDPTATDAKLIDDLHRIFRIDAWRETRRTVTQMLESLQTTERTNDRAGELVEDAWQMLLKHQASKARAQQKIADLNDEIPIYEERITELTTKIANLAPLTEKTKALQEEISGLELIISKAEQEIQIVRDLLKLSFSNSARSIWIGSAARDVVKWLPKHIVERPEAPEKMLRWLLDGKRNSAKRCICGTELCPDGKAYEALKSLLQEKGNTSSYDTLQSTLKYSQELTGKNHASKIGEFSLLLQRLDKSATSREDSRKLIEPKRRELEQVKSTEAQQAVADLRRVQNAMREKTIELGGLNKSLDAWDHRIRLAKDEHRKLKAALPKNQQAELARNEQRAVILQALLDLVNSTEQSLKLHLVNGIQKRLSANYDSAATDGSRAKVSGGLTPTIQRNGVMMSAVGGGQKLMLELAYVVALADVYKEVCDSFKDSDVGLPVAGNISIFADAAFAHSADQYNKKIVSFLADSSAQQVCLLMHKAQWNNVKSWVEPKIGRCYAFRLNSSSDLSASDEFQDSINGHELHLFSKLAEGEESFTKIEHIF